MGLSNGCEEKEMETSQHFVIYDNYEFVSIMSEAPSSSWGSSL